MDLSFSERNPWSDFLSHMFPFQLHVCWVGAGIQWQGKGMSTYHPVLSSPPELERDCGGKEGRAVMPKLLKRAKGSWLNNAVAGSGQVEEGVGRWSR